MAAAADLIKPKKGRKPTDQRSTATAEQELKLNVSSKKKKSPKKRGELVPSFLFFVVGNTDWILGHKTCWDRQTMIYQQTQVCTKLQAWGLNLQNNDICCNWWGWRGCVTKPRENVGRFLVTDHHLASMMESVSYMILHHPIISHKQSIEFTAVKCAKPWKMSPEDDVVWQKLPPGQNFKTSIPQRNQRCHKPTGQNSPPKNDLPFQVGMWNLCPRFTSHAKHARGLVNPNCKPCKSCKDSEAPSNLPQI